MTQQMKSDVIQYSTQMDYLSSDLARQQVGDLMSSFGNLKCKESKAVKLICCQAGCNYPSLHCQSQQCRSCSKNHPMCTTIQLSKWSSAIKLKSQHAAQAISKLLELEQSIIRKMLEFRNESIVTTYFGWLPLEYGTMLGKVFMENKLELLRGREASKITQIIKKSQEQKDIRQKEILNNFILESNKIIESYQQLKQRSISSLAGADIQKIPSQVPLNQSIQNKIQIKSKLVTNVLEQNKLKMWLKNPLKFNLIFTASEHGFSSAKFHQVCDNTPHTLTIIKTEFGKRIGGYTPLAWNSVLNNYSKDSSGESFIFSLDLKEKMSLIRPEDAIFCYGFYGPSFGTDICINNECHKNNNSYANFPNSYNCNPAYKNGQQSYTAFCGAPSGRNFKVLQYEVFKVIWK